MVEEEVQEAAAQGEAVVVQEGEGASEEALMAVQFSFFSS
jgi:hypothetical protein